MPQEDVLTACTGQECDWSVGATVGMEKGAGGGGGSWMREHCQKGVERGAV